MVDGLDGTTRKACPINQRLTTVAEGSALTAAMARRVRNLCEWGRPILSQCNPTRRLYVPAALAGSVLVLAMILDTGPALTRIRLPEDKTIIERARPDFDPLGARAGSFIIYPRIEISEAYDSNIFAEETATVDDLITVVHPSLTIKSDAANHFLKFTAGVKAGRYADRDTEDYEDVSIAVEGRIDVLRDTQLTGRLSYNMRHEERSSADDDDGKSPVEYDDLALNLGGVHEFNRLSIQLSGSVRKLDYDDASTSSGAVLNQDDRDRSIYKMSLRAGYELAPEYEGFVRTNFNAKEYVDATDDDGVNRDSSGYEFVVGATADFSGVTFGEVFAGYLSQDYDDSQLLTVDGFVFGAEVTWNPTSLTTVTGSAKRLVKETTQTSASGVLYTEFSVGIDHELLREFLLHFGLLYGNSDYQGITREDDYLKAVLSAKYMLNRNYYLGASYTYTSRDSTVSGSDYDRNVFMLRLGLQY